MKWTIDLRRATRDVHVHVWHEQEHPRGQPKNAGQFASSAGGKASSDPSPTPATSSQTAPAAGLMAGHEVPETPEGRAQLAAQIAAKHGATEAVAAAEARLKSLKGYETIGPVDKGGFVQPNGQFTPERAALHRKIINQVFSDEAVANATPAEGSKPVATFLGGRGGSGKSWLSRPGGPVDASKTILIDSDWFKSQLPGYEGWNAAIFHEEATHLTDMASKEAKTLGVNVTHDATMKSSAGVSAMIAQYGSAGYDIHGYYMFLPPAAAASRAMGRYVRGGAKGRFVPPEIVLSSVNNEKNFDGLTPHFAKWGVYDNSGDAPKLVAEKG